MHERKNTSEKAKRILRNNAINDAYRENRLLKNLNQHISDNSPMRMSIGIQRNS